MGNLPNLGEDVSIWDSLKPYLEVGAVFGGAGVMKAMGALYGAWRDWRADKAKAADSEEKAERDDRRELTDAQRSEREYLRTELTAERKLRRQVEQDLDETWDALHQCNSAAHRIRSDAMLNISRLTFALKDANIVVPELRPVEEITDSIRLASLSKKADTETKTPT